MGRPKVAALRALGTREGWLAAHTPLPEDAAIATAVGRVRRARSTVSTVEPYRERVARRVPLGLVPERCTDGFEERIARLLLVRRRELRVDATEEQEAMHGRENRLHLAAREQRTEFRTLSGNARTEACESVVVESAAPRLLIGFQQRAHR